MMKLTDLTMTKERAKSTFKEDFPFALMSEAVLKTGRVFDWHDPAHEPQGEITLLTVK